MVIVHAANIADVTAAKTVFRRLKPLMKRLVVIWADRGYEGLEGWLIGNCQWVLHIVKPPPGTKGFTLLPRRWVVERTFAWLNATFATCGCEFGYFSVTMYAMSPMAKMF